MIDLWVTSQTKLYIHSIYCGYTYTLLGQLIGWQVWVIQL